MLNLKSFKQVALFTVYEDYLVDKAIDRWYQFAGAFFFIDSESQLVNVLTVPEHVRSLNHHIVGIIKHQIVTKLAEY